jgi:hypothetical protein
MPPPIFSGAVQEIAIDELVTLTTLTFAGRPGAEIKTKMSNLVRTTHFWNNLHQVRSKSKGWKTK